MNKCKGLWLAAACAGAVSSASAAYRIDDFTVQVGGATVFADDFNDGTPPEVGLGGYVNTSGAFAAAAETGGRLSLDPGAGRPLGAGMVQFAASFGGALNGQAFNVQGRFDVVTPKPGDFYFVLLDDISFVGGVFRATSYGWAIRQKGGQTFASLALIDYVTGSITDLFDSSPLSLAGQSQVVLGFEGTGNGSVTPTYQFMDVNGVAGTVVTVGSFAPAEGHFLFGSAFGAYGVPDSYTSAVPEPATAWLLLAGVGVLGAAARRRTRPSSQA